MLFNLALLAVLISDVAMTGLLVSSYLKLRRYCDAPAHGVWLAVTSLVLTAGIIVTVLLQSAGWISI